MAEANLPAQVKKSTAPDNNVRLGVVNGDGLVTVQGAVVNAGALKSAAYLPGETVVLLRQDKTWLVLGAMRPAGAAGLGIGRLLFAAQSSAVNTTAVIQDLPGAVLNFTTAGPAVLKLEWTADFEVIGATITTAVVTHRTDGVLGTRQAIYEMPVAAAAGRSTCSQTEVVNVAAGDHTVQLICQRAGGADAQIRVNNIHTTLTATVFE